MILRRTWRRLSRRGPDQAATDALIQMLAQRSVIARAAADFGAASRSVSLPAGSRVVAALALGEPLRLLLLSRIEGNAAGHAGRMRVVGVHVLLDRAALGEDWPSGWSAAVRAMPIEPPGGLGAAREFEWRAADASDAAALAAVERLRGIDRVSRRVIGLLRDGSAMQFEIVPTASTLRVAVHQAGQELPDPTAVEAVITVAHALAGAER